MTASRSARERKAASEAGPLAKVKIDLDADRRFVYKISCSECVVRGGRNWEPMQREPNEGCPTGGGVTHLRAARLLAAGACAETSASMSTRLQQNDSLRRGNQARMRT